MYEARIVRLTALDPKTGRRVVVNEWTNARWTRLGGALARAAALARSLGYAETRVERAVELHAVAF